MNTPGTEDADIPQFVDTLDDVFGSASASRVLCAQDHPIDHEGNHNVRITQASEPSDIPRLRSTHVTSGYREGIAASKEQHIQEGFDEGYPLGAELGLKAGWCLGALKGLIHAIPPPHSSAGSAELVENSNRGHPSKGEIEKILEDAKEDLGMQNLISKDHFGPDGIWIYNVPGHEDEGDVSFSDVASAHPVIKKWTERIRQMSQSLGLHLN